MPLLVFLPEGRGPAPLPAHIAVERDLIDWGEEVRAADTRNHILCRGTGVGRKALDEPRIKRIGVVGVAVVAEVPDRQDLVAVHRLNEGIERREVVLPTTIDEGPGDALPRDPDAQAAQKGIVFLHMLGVARLLDQVAPALVLPHERRALEARQKERRKDALVLGHGCCSSFCGRDCTRDRVKAGGP